MGQNLSKETMPKRRMKRSREICKPTTEGPEATSGSTSGNGGEEETLRCDDFQEILKVLKINLPEGSLNEETVASSRNSIVVNDAEKIREELRNGKLTFTSSPRLACGNVGDVMRLRKEKNVQEIMRVIFFKPRKDSEETLKEHWEENISNGSCGLKIKDTFQENLTRDQAKENGNDLRRLKLQINDYKREPKIEHGFLSGRSDFPVELSGSRTSQTGNSNIVGGDLLASSSDIQLNITHQDYYQALAYKYLLAKVLQPPVSAVVVITEHQDKEDGHFYGNVSEDTTEIEELNEFCQKEVLPRFLAVLNLIFEKVKQEVKPLGLDGYKTALKLLKIKVPEEFLTPEVIKHSTDPDIIKDAEAMVQCLQSSKFRISPIPRLGCTKVQRVNELKGEGKHQNVTKMIFLRRRKTVSENTLKQQWDKTMPHTRNGLRIKETYQESLADVGEDDDSETCVKKMKCLKFFIQKEDLSDMRYKREPKLEYGFFSGKPDFQVKDKCNGADGPQKITIKCAGTSDNKETNLYTKPDRGWRADLIKTHPYYQQSVAYQYILQKTQRCPVKAAIVIREQEEDLHREGQHDEERQGAEEDPNGNEGSEEDGQDGEDDEDEEDAIQTALNAWSENEPGQSYTQNVCLSFILVLYFLVLLCYIYFLLSIFLASYI